MTGRTGVGTPRTTPRASSSSPQSGPDLRIIHQGQRPFGRPKAGYTSAVRTEHAALRRENPCRAGTVHTRRCSGAPSRAGSAGPCRPPAPPPPASRPPARGRAPACDAPPARPGTGPPPVAARPRPAPSARPPPSWPPPSIGYTADQRPRAARGATGLTVKSRGRWYKACWRRAATALKAGSGGSVQMDWTNAKKTDNKALHVADMYPGSDVVDIIDTHYYDSGPEKNTQGLR